MSNSRPGFRASHGVNAIRSWLRRLRIRDCPSPEAPSLNDVSPRSHVVIPWVFPDVAVIPIHVDHDSATCAGGQGT